MGERTIEGTLELKMDGDKLTGTLTGSNGRDQQLDEVTFKNGELSFLITTQREQERMTPAEFKGASSF